MAKPEPEKQPTPSPETNGQDDFVVLATDRPTWKPSKTGTKEDDSPGTPITGVLLDRQDMPGDRVWGAYIVKVIGSAIAYDRDKKRVEVEHGDEVFVPATFELDRELLKFVGSTTHLAKVRITPKKKIKIGGGRTMWMYEIGVGRKLILRTSEAAPMLPNVQPRQLPPPGKEEDELPF